MKRREDAKSGKRRMLRKKESLRTEEPRAGLLKGQAVGARYPRAYDDGGIVDEATSRASELCDIARANGGVDEDAVRYLATCVVGAGYARARAELDLQKADNAEILDAMAVAEAEQLAWLQAMEDCYASAAPRNGKERR